MSEPHRAKLNREEIAEIEIGHTNITPLMRVVMVFGFLATILIVPLIQQIIEVRAGLAEKGHWVWPKAYEVFSYPAQAWDTLTMPGGGDWWKRTVAANGVLMRDFKAYEKALEDNSFLAKYGIPRMQAFTARYAGLGNEQAYIGRDGWLFYRPEVDYLTGPGFLDSRFQLRRSRSGDASTGAAIQPDPVKAITRFNDQLKSRGIHLIVMPAPVKPMIEPERLSSRYDGKGNNVLQNPSYDSFLNALNTAGVDVLDVSGKVAENKTRENGDAQFLDTDTHWKPETMELAASLLAEKIRGLALFDTTSTVSFSSVDQKISGMGDIATMLKLLPSQTLYSRQEVQIRQILKSGGTPWASDPSAQILVLGDSFSNIYSLEPMGWGASAGFAEQLGDDLQKPVDAILRNDAGAFATREILARELAQGRDRLAGKRVVVWEFAMRELAVGDWKMIDLALGQAPTPKGGFFAPKEGAQLLRITGTIEAASKVPRPGSVPYKDHVFALHLTDVSGNGVPPASQAVVYLWGMRNATLTKAAEWKAGDHVTLDVRSWNDVAADYERFNRSELDDAALQLEQPCWGEPAK